MKIKIAILMTSFNRKKITLKSIKNIYNQTNNSTYKFKIFLTDDNSPDNTANFIKKKYPDISILKGNGNLYWTGGTNKSWRAAIKDKINFDYYLWLNDDTFLFPSAISDLLSATKFFTNKDVICVGSTKDKNNKRTYGGMQNLNSKIRIFKNKNVMPNNEYQFVNRFNGNIVLISREAQKKIGFINKNLTHYYGDIDYGIRAIKLSVPIILAKGFQGQCEITKKKLYFKDLFSNKRIFKSGLEFCSKNGGKFWIIHFINLLYKEMLYTI